MLMSMLQRKPKGSSEGGQFASGDSSRDKAGQVVAVSEEDRCHVLTYSNGDEYWMKDRVGGSRVRHREGAPAVKRAGGFSRGGTDEYWVDGFQFNPDGPSKCWGGPLSEGGSEEWTNERGQNHREGAPAIQTNGGSKNGGEDWWYRNGELHREDGPAFQIGQTYQAWYWGNKRHRTDGPALIDTETGAEEYWLNGIWYRNKADWEVAKLLLKKDHK